MSSVLIIPRIFSIILYVLFFSLNVVEAMLPVKRCDSLDKFKVLHIKIAESSLEVQAQLLSHKFEMIDKLDLTLSNSISGIRDEILSYQRSLSRKGEPYFLLPEKTLNSTISQLNTKLKDIDTEIKLLSNVDIINCEINNLPTLLNVYKTMLINNMRDKIKLGDYSALFSSLPASFFIETHVPNTFTCAITLLYGNDNTTDLFVKKRYKTPLATLYHQETLVFTSGSEKGDFFKTSLLVQSAALGGSIPVKKMQSVSNTPSDLYRHSEQVCFSELSVLEFSKSVVEQVKDAVKEIIFHGNTLRDMCPNCRATLIAHEMLTTRNSLTKAETPDSFLCALQEMFFKKFAIKPRVTCIISSFVKYDDRCDYSWDIQPPVYLLDMTKRAPVSICSNFVNQFAFSEKEFLEMLIPKLQSKESSSLTIQDILASLRGRLEALNSEDEALL